MSFRFDSFHASSAAELRQGLRSVLDGYRALLPSSPGARVVLKPNFNSNMNALTGNTTDLRLLAALVLVLREFGYHRIAIAEGTNSGFYRNRISVMERLAVGRFARRLGVELLDLNYAEPYPVPFGDVTAYVARECVEADLFINVPKLKTHFEMGMSVCLKNMMGCLLGQENKKKTHLSLSANILRLNEVLKPHLHVVDALIAMEGLGPTRGTPVRLDQVLVGTDPLLLDLAAAKLARFEPGKVGTLRAAEAAGLLTDEHRAFVASLELDVASRPFAPPVAGALAGFIHSPRRQKYFLMVRNTRFFSWLASTGWFGHLLFLTGLRQDVFCHEDSACQGLSVDGSVCDGCGVCARVCPMELDLPKTEVREDDGCIRCLYCYSACPRRAIRFLGELGFFREQLRQYDARIRSLYGGSSGSDRNGR
ncbi:MAG: DUF362 domain-containing protein [Deltaproteobacteria bacterium]|nr:DUF362 domain-containing protein [Deltaproteobacteria bacterium]